MPRTYHCPAARSGYRDTVTGALVPVETPEMDVTVDDDTHLTAHGTYYRRISERSAVMNLCEFDPSSEASVEHWALYLRQKNAGMKIQLVEGTPDDASEVAEKRVSRNAKRRKGKGSGDRRGDNRLRAFMLASKFDEFLDAAERMLYEASEEQAPYVEAWMDTIEQAAEGDRAALEEFAERLTLALQNAGADVAEARVILHDRDEREVWDEARSAFVMERKDTHFHLLVRFASRDTGLTVAQVAATLRVSENMIEKPQRGRYAYDNLLAYLIHAKESAPGKYHYDAHDVVTVIGDDYVEVWRENKAAWDRGRATKAAKQADVDVDWLVDECAEGRITLKQILMKDEWYAVYRHKSAATQIDHAIDAHDRRQMLLAAEAMDRHEFRTTTIYAHGPAGSGKSTLAMGLIGFWVAAYGWRWASISPGHGMDDYHGEEILLLDDCYVSTMTAADWLHLLDPDHAHPASARYKNKPRLAPRVVMMLTNKAPLGFFYFARMGAGERSVSVDTFFRRLTLPMFVGSQRTYGFYNIQRFEAVEGEPYEVSIDTGRKNWQGYPERETLTGLRWKLVGMSGYDSPYAAAEVIVREVDARSAGSELARAGRIDAAVRDAMGYVRAAYLPAIESGALPPLPGPDDGYALSCAKPVRRGKDGKQHPLRWGLPDGPELPLAGGAGEGDAEEVMGDGDE